MDPSQLPTEPNNRQTNDQSPSESAAAHTPLPLVDIPRASKKIAVKTYRDYAAESMSKGGGSLTKMIIAEREKKQSQHRRSAKNPKNILVTVLSVLFVVLGIGLIIGAFFLVRTVQQNNNAVAPAVPQPLVLYEYRRQIHTPKPTRTKLLRSITRTLSEISIPTGELMYVYFTQDNQNNAEVLTTSTDLFTALDTKASATLLRSFDDNFMYGIYSTTEHSPFLIIPVDHYQVAYAQMLAWETTMGRDIGALFDKTSHDYARANFSDVAYYNKDARVILDSAGDVVLGYSFVTENTIIIFANRLTLRELVNRAQSNTLKR